MGDIDTRPRNVKYQYFAAYAANLMTFSYGAGVGWFSPALPLLQSDKTPLKSGEITIEDVSWIGSILSLGCILNNFLMGYLVTKIGSKHSIALLGIPMMGAWSCMIFGTTAIHLYAARFFVGMVGGGVEITISLFIAEISDNSIRGKLGTIYSFSRNFGILVAFVLGAYFDYIFTSKIFVGVVLLFYGVFLFCLPSSPQYQLQNKQIEEAEKAFKFYKGYKNRKQSKSYLSEFDQLMSASNSKEESGFELKDLFEPQARKGMILAVIFPLLNILSGAYIFLTYATDIIAKSAKSETSLSSEMAAISLAVVQIIGTFLTLYLVDVKGRKFLLILSMGGCAAGHTVMIAYLYLTDKGFDTSAFHAVPVACMAFVVLVAAIGIFSLTHVCLVEAFPVKVRSAGITFGSVVLNIFTFVAAKAFPILAEIIQLQGCLLICAIGSALGVVYLVLFVEETKGKDLNATAKDDNVCDQIDIKA